MKSILIFVVVFCFKANGFSQNMYSCFQSDTNPDLKILVCHNSKYRITYVKYFGQHETIPVFFQKYNTYQEEGATKNWWNEIYVEKYREKITGTYMVTNSGIGGLDITYTRKRDGKKFYFKLIETENGYSKYLDSPCF
jgi:hypothetical protein